MKKIVAIMILSLLLILVGCGAEADPNASTNNTSTTNSNPSSEGTPSAPPEKEPVFYTIKWIDKDGQEISSNSVEEGKIPSCEYIVEDTREWDYTFDGWALSADGDVVSKIPAATQDQTYYAIVSSVKQKYTVTFNSNGGSAVASQTVEYGSVATIPTEPIYEGYKFMGWCTDVQGEELVDFDVAITDNVEYFAIWNEIIDAKALLGALLSGYKMNPYAYIPESMMIDYSANLVKSSDVINDYSGFVNVGNITYGFGEQWNMVLENLEQTKIFFNALSVIEGLTSTSIVTFNNYFDKNPGKTAHHTFESGIYNIAIDIDEKYVIYVVEFTANFPVIEEQTAQIALMMDIATGEKTVRIQLGDANALLYRIGENHYEFAVKYLGVRRAMFSIEEKQNGEIVGRIYEYLTALSSCAEFYIDDDYVSVVGNKASGMMGFTNYIVEVYDVDAGNLLGYEIQETLSKITYNTLWFNLDDIDGIDTIKVVQTSEDDVEIYVNGSKKAWQPKKNLLTRRFDIEMRTQYVYSYNADTQEYTMHEIKVPMLFVQEENMDTLVADVNATNDITIMVDVSASDLARIIADYYELIPVYIISKDLVTADFIVEYIGERIKFE